MNYREAIEFLYGLRLFGTKFGLENTRRLAALAGQPHERLRFIHVAGTNGKGSTCAMLEGIYRAAGLRVGLFTSPHLIAFGERIQVNRRLISEAGIARAVEEMRPWLAEFSKEAHPTFFEVVTVMALRYFAEQRCDLVIWETGLGGRLDATNIVTPQASLITNVQFDHQQWLGDSLEKIAFEKAGIIKPGVPVITGADAPEALKVIREIAVQRNAPLTLVAADEVARAPIETIRLPLLGEHQRRNAALALATVRALQPQIPVSEEAVRAGLEQVHWLGRLQVIRAEGGRTFVLDGAHNPAGADTLRSALQQHFPGTQPALILGIMRDKDWPAMCRMLAPLANRIFLCPVQSERTAPPEKLAQACAAANPLASVAVCRSIGEALEKTAQEKFVVITGSLHFIGEALEHLQELPNGRTGERSLNEWDSQPKPVTRQNVQI